MRRDGSKPRRDNPKRSGPRSIGVGTESVLATRASRLGVALSGMAHELAAAHRQIAKLRRENAALRAEVETTSEATESKLARPGISRSPQAARARPLDGPVQ